jgi:DNA-directed RNA polymerase specialized sigma24 family protein
MLAAALPTIRDLSARRQTDLHDVDDAEAFAGAIASRSGLHLNFHEFEELVTYLVEAAWELSLRYRPGGISFSSWAGTTLRLRIIEWRRHRDGRTKWQFANGVVHERPRPAVVSLDDGNSEHDSLGVSLAAGAGDPAEGCDPDFERLVEGGGRSLLEDLYILGLEPPRRAA